MVFGTPASRAERRVAVDARVKIPSQKGRMKKVYAKDGEFQKEIELKWDKHEKAFILTKRNISCKNSQGHSM
jgi:hypothetical protein